MSVRIGLWIVLWIALPIPGWAQTPAFAATPQTSDGPAANEPDLLLAAEDWQALAAGSGSDRICYVTRVARARSVLSQRDVRPLLYVTHRPSRQSYDVVAFAASYAFRADSMARVSLGGGPSYRLFTDGTFAWAGDEAIDRRIVRAMAEGGSITVTGLGADGLLRDDNFGLSGFATAFQRASSECRRPGAPIKR